MTEKYESFKKLVKEMREAQKDYFRNTADKNRLRKSIALEKKVDDYIKSDGVKQESIFNG